MTRSRCFAFLILLAFAVPASAQTANVPADQWTVELSMKYKSIGGVDLSPDGRLIAYSIREPVMEGEKSEYRTQIWIASADGSRNVQYTRGEHSADGAQFSPDGEFLAFTSARSGKNQVWLLRIDGGEAEQVTEQEDGVGSFRWSPDGTRIAYTLSDPKSEEEKKAEKEKRDVILVDQNFKFSHLYVQPVAKNAAGERPVTRLTEGSFHVSAFTWTPDGSAIVFGQQPDPRINTGFMNGDISVVRMADRVVTPLVTGAGVDGNPRVSPDGRTVAFVSSGPRAEPVGLADVWVVPMAGGTPRKLADTPDRSANIVGWSADSRDVLVTESVGTERHLIALPADGSAPRNITHGAGVHGAVDLSEDGSTMAFTWEDSDTPSDLYVSAVTSTDRKRITQVNADVPRPAMGRTEVLTWKSKDGKFDIEGLLTYPVNYRDGSRVPLILNVHGGPAGVFAQSFTGAPSIYMLQTFAQQGYAVLRPNPRGSTGYGKEFRFANVKDWGYGDMDDLMAGVDHVIGMGVAHADSLLLMGWSYGGYMTSFAVTRTDRFKAASMGAGLPNLVSMVTTTDIPDYLAGHMDGEFWNDYDTYEKHSAMYRIANVKTPTQVIHGANDLRVPFTQGQEFYVALQRRGIDTEMIVYPRTPHGPREPKLLMDVTGRILTWFDKHLGRRAVTTDQS
jgi:dipeptidyl aminopeptidase/acylaminoacyl peptidase